MTYKGPVRLTDPTGEPRTVDAVLEWVGDDGDWSGVLTGPLDWSRLAGDRLTLESPATAGGTSRSSAPCTST